MRVHVKLVAAHDDVVDARRRGEGHGGAAAIVAAARRVVVGGGGRAAEGEVGAGAPAAHPQLRVERAHARGHGQRQSQGAAGVAHRRERARMHANAVSVVTTARSRVVFTQWSWRTHVRTAHSAAATPCPNKILTRAGTGYSRKLPQVQLPQLHLAVRRGHAAPRVPASQVHVGDRQVPRRYCLAVPKQVVLGVHGKGTAGHQRNETRRGLTGRS